MQHASQRSPGWSGLQPELVLQVAALLDNEDRWSLVGTCAHWRGTVAAGPPDLWPTAVLTCLAPDFERLAGGHWEDAARIERAYAAGVSHAMGLMRRAAVMPPLTRRVRIEGAAQPATVPGLLAVLPPGLRWLELDAAPCAGALLPALARFGQLQQLTITGNGADVQWDVGTPAVLAPLDQLCLDYRRAPNRNPYGTEAPAAVESPPEAVRSALTAATGLHTLELRATWSDVVAAVCHALPALRHLSLHAYKCANEHGAAAVQLLRALTQLTGVALGIHGSFGSELDSYPMLDQWEEYVFLAPLAGLSALTELCLVGGAQLPPDFRQLSRLQRLAVTEGFSAEGGDFDWGGAPLTALASLTRVEINQGTYGMRMPDPAVLASAPLLAEVLTRDATHAPLSNSAQLAGWRAQLAALRPDLHIT